MMSRERHDKQLFHLIECAVSCSHGNYNLDAHPEVTPEFFTLYYRRLIGELIEMGHNYRKYYVKSASKRKNLNAFQAGSAKKKLRFSHKKKKVAKDFYKSKNNPIGNATVKGLNCPMRKSLAAALRLAPKEGTVKNTRPSMRRVVCTFCGKKQTMYVCRGCDQAFCMLPPTHLSIPVICRKWVILLAISPWIQHMVGIWKGSRWWALKNLENI